MDKKVKKFVLIIYKYFPFGGAQRDMMLLAEKLSKTFAVEILTMEWNAIKPSKNIQIKLLKNNAFFNHKKYSNFQQKALEYLESQTDSISIAFSKLSGFDFYYAADSCFTFKNKNFFLNLFPRNKFFLKQEKDIFSNYSHTKILSISKKENQIYQSIFKTDNKKFIFIPPFIDKKFFTFNKIISDPIKGYFSKNKNFILFVGSGFKTKGLDRSIHAFASLPHSIQKNYNFAIFGKDKAIKYQKLIDQYNLSDSIKIFEGHNDIHKVMREASLLIHPARYENTGLILLEALSQNLPIITTENCGYSHYVKDHNYSIVLNNPFEQNQLNAALQKLLKTTLKKPKTPDLSFKKFTNYQLDIKILANI